MITRQLNSIVITFKSDGSPLVTATAMVTDSDENTQSGTAKLLNQAAVITIAEQMRDKIITLAESAGKPVVVGGGT